MRHLGFAGALGFISCELVLLLISSKARSCFVELATHSYVYSHLRSITAGLGLSQWRAYLQAGLPAPMDQQQHKEWLARHKKNGKKTKNCGEELEHASPPLHRKQNIV